MDWLAFILYMKMNKKKRNSWIVKNEPANGLTRFMLYMKRNERKNVLAE